MYGKIEYNEEGLPKCEICGLHFSRVGAHSYQKHKVTAKEYKIMFGLDVGRGICSHESSDLSKEIVYKNYEKVVSVNLTNKGISTRFKKGHKGRTKDKVSAQTHNRLAENGRLAFSKLNKSCNA